ncbi:hypothetical protein BCR33DRAFT_717914 [Rhizoclosmatium globosum]|uniref:Uncharacterized protein n=1 Tax=Rhizoclosmatium globosum TaxID=329046 RepID=A0A1Y2C6R4_9FUNG|nr:hypothetical protein BCR33DRAFT_717914 [Rhizoclosmatium globosum]|eukprot:ORY42723.1 hypothetical protein BCR33DRAFT_717914 [Rhizoclosmatium globosum]
MALYRCTKPLVRNGIEATAPGLLFFIEPYPLWPTVLRVSTASLPRGTAIRASGVEGIVLVEFSDANVISDIAYTVEEPTPTSTYFSDLQYYNNICDAFAFHIGAIETLDRPNRHSLLAGNNDSLYSEDDALALKLIRRSVFGVSGHKSLPISDADSIHPVCLALFFDAASSAILSLDDSSQECINKQELLESSSDPKDVAEFDFLEDELADFVRAVQSILRSILTVFPNAYALMPLVPTHYFD